MTRVNVVFTRALRPRGAPSLPLALSYFSVNPFRYAPH